MMKQIPFHEGDAPGIEFETDTYCMMCLYCKAKLHCLSNSCSLSSCLLPIKRPFKRVRRVSGTNQRAESKFVLRYWPATDGILDLMSLLINRACCLN